MRPSTFAIAALFRGLSLVALTAVVLASGACNDVPDCPSPSSIQPNASCSGDHLECPYTLTASDGTKTPTSCTCVSGKWTCPTDAADAAASDDASGADASGADASGADASGADASGTDASGADAPATEGGDGGGDSALPSDAAGG